MDENFINKVRKGCWKEYACKESFAHGSELIFLFVIQDVGRTYLHKRKKAIPAFFLTQISCSSIVFNDPPQGSLTKLKGLFPIYMYIFRYMSLRICLLAFIFMWSLHTEVMRLVYVEMLPHLGSQQKNKSGSSHIIMK